MDEDGLKEVLRLHGLWLNGEPDGERADLSHADLRDMDLQRADLRFVVMRQALLCGANLRESRLEYAEMYRADLREADMFHADLTFASMQCANLARSSMRDANCASSNFMQADMGEVDLTGAHLGFDAFFGGVKHAPLYQAVCGFGSRNSALTLLAIGERKDWKWFTGCFEGSEEELRAAVAKRYWRGGGDEGYSLALDYLVAQATRRFKE